MRAIGRLAFAQRSHEIRERPAADTGLRMRRDVRSVERAEGCLQGAAAGIRRRVLALFGMAAEATGRFRQVFTALRVALRYGEGGAQQKEKPRQGGASREPQFATASGGSSRDSRRSSCRRRRSGP